MEPLRPSGKHAAGGRGKRFLEADSLLLEQVGAPADMGIPPAPVRAAGAPSRKSSPGAVPG